MSHLASAGVQALHELVEQMATDCPVLRLIAPPECPVYPVLRPTGLDHLAVLLAAPPSAQEPDGPG